MTTDHVAFLILFAAVAYLVRGRRPIKRMSRDLKACRCPYFFFCPTHLVYPQPDCPVHGLDAQQK